MAKVLIAGGGYSGLIAAYSLLKKGHQITVMEKQASVGGLLKTEIQQTQLLESAAVGWVRNYQVNQLFKDLHIQQVKPSKDIQRKYIFTDGKIKSWPLTIFESTSLAKGLIKKLFRPVSFQPHKNETMSEWSQRVFSKSVGEKLILPGLQGLYGWKTSELSAELVISRLFASGRPPRLVENGSLTAYPQGGMQSMMLRLRDFLKNGGVEFKCGEFHERDRHHCDRTLLALGFQDLQRQSGDGTEWASFFSLLKEVPGVSLASVHVLRKPFDKDIAGYGILFPRTERFRAAGLQFTEGLFQDRMPNRTHDRWIFGYRAGEEPEESELIDDVRRDHYRLYGHELESDAQMIVRISPSALPFYGVELKRALDEVPKVDSSMSVVGNCMNTVGLTDILFECEKLAERWSEGDL